MHPNEEPYVKLNTKQRNKIQRFFVTFISTRPMNSKHRLFLGGHQTVLSDTISDIPNINIRTLTSFDTSLYIDFHKTLPLARIIPTFMNLSPFEVRIKRSKVE